MFCKFSLGFFSGSLLNPTIFSRICIFRACFPKLMQNLLVHVLPRTNSAHEMRTYIFFEIHVGFFCNNIILVGVLFNCCSKFGIRRQISKQLSISFLEFTVSLRDESLSMIQINGDKKNRLFLRFQFLLDVSKNLGC